MAHGKTLASYSDVCACPKQGNRSRRLCFLRLTIGYVEHRRHLVAVFCLKSACGKSHATDHIGVYDAQSFLLSASYEERPINLNIVYINGVFIETASADIILRRHLIVGGHACLLLHQFLHGISSCRGRVADILYVEFFCLCSLSAAFGNNKFVERFHWIQHHSQSLFATRVSQNALPCLVANHGKSYYHTVSGLQLQAELSL